eukprot:15092385-Alexandrium_andersonii.AAC.1
MAAARSGPPARMSAVMLPSVLSRSGRPASALPFARALPRTALALACGGIVPTRGRGNCSQMAADDRGNDADEDRDGREMWMDVGRM